MTAPTRPAESAPAAKSSRAPGEVDRELASGIPSADFAGLVPGFDPNGSARIAASLRPSEQILLRLQRTVGNQAVMQYLARTGEAGSAVVQRQAPVEPGPSPTGGRKLPPGPPPAAAVPPGPPRPTEAGLADPKAGAALVEASAEAPSLSPADVTPDVAERLAEKYREIRAGGAVERDRSADPLLRPEIIAAVRSRAPGAVPSDLQAQRSRASDASAGPVQAQRQGGGPIPAIKFKYPLIARKRFKYSPIGMSLAGGYIKPAVTVDMPAIEGTAKAPPHLASDKEFTFEKGKGLIPRVDILNYSDTVTSETLGTFKIESKSGLELRKDKVELNAITVTFTGVEPDSFVQPELAFDLVNWEKGEWPMFLDFSFGATFYKKVTQNVLGWEIEGKLALPVRVHLSVNEDKAAEWIVRTLGPRLVSALPAAAAIGAPLMAGAVCLALWIDAIETGREIASAVDDAYFNSRGYADAFIATANGREFSGGNEGARRGAADANSVINRWKSSGLSPGLVDQVIATHLPGQLNHATIAKQAWDRFSGSAIAEYRARHTVDAWCYDHGLPNDQRLLERVIRTVGSKFG